MRPSQAVFLVGGRGTRLGALSADTPKPLQEIKPGLRFLDLLLDQTARHGFSDIVLLAGHLGEQVEAAYHGRRVREAGVRVMREAAPMGTGGAFRRVCDLLEPQFLAANGDSFFDFNLRALTARPLGHAVGRLALRAVPDASRYGSVRLEGERIAAFLEKSASPAAPSLINAGVYLLDRAILGQGEGSCSLETDVFPSAAAGGRLEGMAFEGYFLDIGLPETLAQARREAAALFVRPAAVFDRDSLIEGDRDRDESVWRPGARQAIRRLNDLGHYVFVLAEAPLPAALRQALADQGGHADAVHPASAGLSPLLAAWPVDLPRSFIIATRQAGLDAAGRAGLPGRLAGEGELAALVEQMAGARQMAR